MISACGAYGMGYRFGAGETELLELGTGGARHEQRALDQVLSLESLAVRPGQLLTYFLWADDVGPDGQVRRSFSDIYFLEVRPFEEIFRENQSGAGEEQAGSQGQPGGPSEQLTELQKEIIAATWSLQRRGTPKVPEGFVDDAGVIRQSQEHALEQAAALAEQTNDPGVRQWVETARTEMERAVRELERAGADASAGPLGPALGAEQAAYEALLQLQTREFQVAQGQRGQGGGSQGRRMQRQLNQLQLKASEDRYETQRQAAPEVDQQQREQLQFLSRLKELAQRQQDLNQRLRELELALQEATTPEEREEVRRELRRLREQQQQMLSDVDELQQRMERPGNQAETAEARRQLEEARDQLQNASEAMEQGSLSQAVASGSRASRQLEELREDFRTRNASQFSEAMREMRGQARDLVEQQEQLSRELTALSENRRPTLSDAEPREDLARLAAEQTAGLTNLLDRVRRVTEESEAAEPLLSRDLYETFRQAAQTDAANLREVTEELLSQGALTRPVYDMLRFPDREGPGQSLATTERLLREGHLDAARQLEEKARADLGQLQRGIERAAEKILGDDTEALRLARSELDELLEQLEQEIAEGRAASGLTNAVASQAGVGRNGAEPAEAGGADEPSAGQRGGGGEPGDRASTSGEPSDSGGEGETEGGRPAGELASAGQAGGEPGSPPDQAGTGGDQPGASAGNRGPGARGEAVGFVRRGLGDVFQSTRVGVGRWGWRRWRTGDRWWLSRLGEPVGRGGRIARLSGSEDGSCPGPGSGAGGAFGVQPTWRTAPLGFGGDGNGLAVGRGARSTDSGIGAATVTGGSGADRSRFGAAAIQRVGTSLLREPRGHGLSGMESGHVASVLISNQEWIFPAVVLVLALAAMAVWSYWRSPAAGRLRAIGLGLKLLGILALAVCLLEPLWVGQRAKRGANYFAVLVDNSRSFQLKDSGATAAPRGRGARTPEPRHGELARKSRGGVPVAAILFRQPAAGHPGLHGAGL